MLTLDELSRQAVVLTNKTVKCPMRNCIHRSEYELCLMHTQISCPIYNSIYSRLTNEQREILNRMEKQ